MIKRKEAKRLAKMTRPDLGEKDQRRIARIIFCEENCIALAYVLSILALVISIITLLK